MQMWVGRARCSRFNAKLELNLLRNFAQMAILVSKLPLLPQKMHKIAASADLLIHCHRALCYWSAVKPIPDLDGREP